MPLNEAKKQELLTELKQFHDGLIRYKQLAVAEKRGNLTKKQETEFQELSVQLQRLYGSLQTVIKEYGGSTDVLLEGGNYKCEAFTSAFSYTGFSRQALIVVMDTAIAAVNIAIGNLRSLTPPDAGQVQPSKAFIAHGGKIDKDKAIKLIKGAIEEIPRLRELHYKNQEFQLWRYKVEDVVKGGFDDSSDEYKRFRASYGAISLFGTEESWQREYLGRLDRYETALKSILQTCEILAEAPTGLLPTEAIYPAGTPYDAYKDIKAVISAASKKLIIVDPWVDSTLFDLLENAQSNVQIQVLTRHIKGDFQLAGQKFKEQREKAQKGGLEVRRESGDFHDRFIVADDRVFHLGASIKDAGGKHSATSEFEDSRVKEVVMKIISESWAGASVEI